MKKLLIGAFGCLVLFASAPASAVITLDFEGIGNECSINNFYNGGTDSCGNSGTNHAIAFGPNSLAVIDADAGGSGNIGNEPTPDTAMFFLTGSAVLNYAAGFEDGFSFFYSSVSFPATVSVYLALTQPAPCSVRLISLRWALAPVTRTAPFQYGKSAS